MKNIAWFGVLVGTLCIVACNNAADSKECSVTSPCEEDSFCDYGDDLCGAGNPTGTCRKAPTSSCGLEMQACGCNGKVAVTCDGAVGLGKAVDIAPLDMCPSPSAGLLLCGEVYCAVDKGEYCQTGYMPEPPCAGSQCTPIPPACSASPTCECLRTHALVDDCSGDAVKGFVVAWWSGDSPDCP